MPPENPVTRRWLRPKIWMMMAAAPVVAMVVVYWAGIDPFRRNPYWSALEEAEEWCSSQAETFSAKGHFDWSKPEARYIQDEPVDPTLPCIVKVSYVWGIHDNGCDTSSYALSSDGRMKSTENIFNWAVQGGQGALTPAETTTCKKLIASLPGSQRWISVGDAIAVGFLDGKGVWTTRLYDKSNLPPEVADLARILGIAFR